MTNGIVKVAYSEATRIAGNELFEKVTKTYVLCHPTLGATWFGGKPLPFVAKGHHVYLVCDPTSPIPRVYKRRILFRDLKWAPARTSTLVVRGC